MDVEGQVETLLSRTDEAHALALRDQAAAKAIFDRLVVAIDSAHSSWSGSWAGYHANLYFRDFTRPELGSQFSVEWGAIHGIPEGWHDRTDAEVTSFIEMASGVLASDLERLSASTYDRARPLYHDVQALVTPILEASGDSSRVLLAELRDEKWGISQAQYLRRARPSQVISRDSEAVMQGTRTPPHIAFRARVASEYSRVSACVSALERARLALNYAKSAVAVATRVRGANDARDSVARAGASGRRALKWSVPLLIGLVAIETFILLRPFVVIWFDATFTQQFLTTPTRLGFCWSDVIANLLATFVLIPFGWLFHKARNWFASI